MLDEEPESEVSGEERAEIERRRRLVHQQVMSKGRSLLKRELRALFPEDIEPPHKARKTRFDTAREVYQILIGSFPTNQPVSLREASELCGLDMKTVWACRKIMRSKIGHERGLVWPWPDQRRGNYKGRFEKKPRASHRGLPEVPGDPPHT